MGKDIEIKKIAVDCRMLQKSGIGTYLKNILIYWLQLSDYQWVLIGKRNIIQEELDISKSNCQIIEYDAPIFSTKELLCFPTKVVNDCDLFFSPNFNIPLGIKIPVYITIHDVVFLDYKDFSGRIGRFIRYISLKRAIKKAKKIFTVSQFTKDRIRKHYKTDKEIIVAYNGINVDLLKFDEKKHSCEYDFRYLLYIGNIKKHKGLDILLDALSELDKKLIIVGDVKGLKTADKKNYKKMSSNKNIILSGRIKSNEHLYSIISNAEALIQPSRYEGFGIPPLEALYLDTPVILSDIDVFKEIYANLPVAFFRNCDYTDLKLKIQNIQKQNIDRQSLVNRYNYQSTATRIINNFQSIISNPQ